MSSSFAHVNVVPYTTYKVSTSQFHTYFSFIASLCTVEIWYFMYTHGLRTPGEEIAFTARPKIKSQSQIFRYRRSIFCLPHRPKFSDSSDLCLHWMSVVRGYQDLPRFHPLPDELVRICRDPQSREFPLHHYGGLGPDNI